MPSPATRSSRLAKAKQSTEEKEEESKDFAKKRGKSAPSPSKPSPSPAKTRKSSVKKSPRLSQEPNALSLENTKRSKQNAKQAEHHENVPTTNVTSEIPKKEEKEVAVLNNLEPEVASPDVSTAKDKMQSDKEEKKFSMLTPTSSLRRSSRAPVPSSRFKDMEVGSTPNSQKMKRAFLTSPSGDSDATTEPSPKRSKKNSNKSVEVSTNVSGKEDAGRKDLTSDSHIQVVQESPLKDIIVETVQSQQEEKESQDKEETESLKQTLSNKELKSAEQIQFNHDVNEGKTDSSKEMDVSEGDELGEISDKESVKVLTINTPNEKLPTESEEEKSKTTDQNAFLSPDLSANISNNAIEATPQEVSVEEVGLSCHHSGMIVEETVHTYMEEKDVVIQDQNITENLDDQGETSHVHTPKELEISLDKGSNPTDSPSVMIKGHEVTVQERDGKMVAIVKMPSNFGSHFTSPPSTETTQVLQTETATEEQFPISSSLKNIILNAPPSQKNRHGYILNKKTPENNKPFVTISDEDQGILNISLEPTTISSILKSKQEATPAKSTSKSLYGRVIKQDTLITKPSADTSPLVQNSSSASIIIKNAGSNQKISLLSHPIKGTNPKDCKPYSLLSSPSELLQKLKGDSEKKQAAKVAQEPMKISQLSSASQKVVIITHPPKPDGQAEKTSSLLTEGGTPVELSKGESSEPLLSADSNLISVDSELKSGPQVEQEELLEITTTQVVEEVASVEESAGDSSKFEEIVVPDILQESENAEPKEERETGQGDEDECGHSDIAKEGEDVNKSKEVIIESVVSLSQPEESGEDVTSDLLISHGDKAAVEETVITSSAQSDIQVKQELGLGNDDSSTEKSVELLTVGDKGKNETAAPKTQKIKLVDNGVVYELQIVSEEGESRSFPDDALELEGMDGDDGMTVKQEIIDDEESASSDTVGKSSLGTQTIYTSKRGRPRVSGDKEDSDSPVHKLATIVQEGGQKKHYYYVSVVPGKTMDGKYRRSVDHSLPGCVVNDIGEYCCKECDYKTDKKANFYKHRRLHTGSKPHVCQECKYQARTSSNLKRHMGIHEDIREFKCNQCSLSFRQKIHLERHIRYRHEEKRVKCPMCDYVCANEQPDLKMHIKRKHTQESGKVFTCPQCKIEVCSKRDLKQHLKFHKDGPELKLFCKECSFVTDCKSRLQRHLVVHSNVKPYHCGVCDYKATQKEHVVRHLRSQHKIEVNKPKRPWKKQIKQEASETLGGNSRGDFTCGDKIFACNHCTMRFAKLINLYKHLHTQHSDIMPAETESNYYCVVCEFSTSSKKNLLVHMRRHNMTDQTPPTHVYSCVLCRYVNPRRRNLFQHMRKKHNIDISTQVDIAGMTEEEEAAVRQDGEKMSEFIHTDQGVFTQGSTEEMASSNFESTEGGAQAMKDNLAGVANMIKIEDLTRVAAGAEGKDSTGLVIDNSDGTQLIQATSLMQHKAADAIEGLQALAGQAGLIIDEEVSTLDKQPTIVIEQGEGGVIHSTDATLADGSIIISTDQSIVEEQVAIEETSSEQIQQIVESVEASEAGSGLTSLELTEEQLSSLHHGDIVQMEGQVYMVELAQDPESPDKQLLSFLPINQG